MTVLDQLHKFLIGHDRSSFKANVRYKERLSIIFENAKTTIHKINFDKYKKYREATLLIGRERNKKSFYLSTFNKFGIQSGEEYIKILFYLTHILKPCLSPKELAIIFDQSLSGIQSKMRDLGLNVDFETGIKNKKLRGSHDYEKAIRNGKATRVKSLAENSTGGSANENNFRSLISIKIYDFLPSNQFDIVVGFNNTGILKAKEIDIPLIVYDIQNNTLYRFALEYNGPFHSQKQDEWKMNLALRRGWIYIPITENSNDWTSNSDNKLNQKVLDVCTTIKNYVYQGAGPAQVVNGINESN